MSYDENRIDNLIQQGLETEEQFNKWLEENSQWQYIQPLKVFQHSKKEIYKTYDELKEIYLDFIRS